MRTVYTVTGESSVRPTDLPAGLKVEEKVSKFEQIIGASRDGDACLVKVTELTDGIAAGRTRLALVVPGVERASLNLTTAQLRKLRDSLSERLGEGPAKPNRVFRTTGISGTKLWFEIETDRFVNGVTWTDAEYKLPNATYGRTYEDLSRIFDLTEVSHKHPRS